MSNIALFSNSSNIVKGQLKWNNNSSRIRNTALNGAEQPQNDVSSSKLQRKNVSQDLMTSLDVKNFFLFRLNINCNILNTYPASWSSGNAFVSGAGGLRFKSRAGQIAHSVANGSPPLPYFFDWSCGARRRNDAEMGPANFLHASA